MVNGMEILLQMGCRKIMLSSDDMNSLVNKGDKKESTQKNHMPLLWH